MKYPIITIAREHGSGGRVIAHKLSKQLNIPVYDKTVIDIAAQECGLSPEFMEEIEKRSSGNFLYNLYLSSANVSIVDQVFLAQSQVIKTLAAESPCIIVGRGGDYVLRDRLDCLRVFVYAPKEDRIRRILNEYHEQVDDPESYLTKRDKQRASYYNSFADIRWGDRRNYHLMVNSSLGLENAVQLIAVAAQGGAVNE